MKRIGMVVVPIATAVALAQPAAQPAPSAVPNYKQLKFPPLRPVKVPEPVVFTLANGMKVYLLEDRELPVLSGSVLVRTGNLFDPSDKRGLADLTGQLIRGGGTKSKTSEQLDEALENMAASVESQIGESSGSVGFSCLRENADAVLALFKEILTQPEFRQDKLDLAKQQAKSGISRRNDDPEGIVSREFANTIYGKDGPYGWSIEYEHVDHVTREDLVAFYKRYFFPKNMVLQIYGDFGGEDMRAKLEKLFADWKVEQPPAPPFPPLRRSKADGVFLAEKDDVTQTFFSIGHLGGLFKDKDYAALQVASNILGSGFSSRLVNTVRTKLGYAYSIGASWGAGFDSPGLFTISGSTKSASTVETIRVIREEVDRMRNAPVTDEELQNAKEQARNSFVFSFDRPSKTLNRAVLYEYFGYPKDFLFQYQMAMQAVTKADVQRVAKEYWKPENFTIVAVGNPKEFGKPLSELHLPVTKIDLTIPEPTKRTAAAETSEVSLAKGKQLAAKAAQAMGGGPVALVRDYETEREMELQTGATSMKVRQTMRIVYPNHLRQDQQLPFGRVIVYSDSRAGWMVGPQGSMPVQEAVIKQVKDEIFHSPFGLLRPSPGKQFNALSEDTIEIADAEGLSAKLKIGADGLPKSLTYVSTATIGAASELVETYSDWREVSGVQLPHRILLEQGGKKYAEIKVTGYRLNVGFRPEDLAKKP